MRFQVETITPALRPDGSQDGFNSQGGFVPAYTMEGYALDDVPEHKVRAGDRLNLKGNFKKPPVQGSTENLQFKLKKDGSGRPISFPDGVNPDGSTLWRQVVERIPQNQRQNGPVQAHTAPQSHANPGQVPKAVPTMSQAIAVMRECIEAIKTIGGSDGHATTLFLARMDGRIRRDPSPAELEAAEAAKARAAEEARLKAEAEAAEAAKRAALAAMPQPELGTDSDIPF